MRPLITPAGMSRLAYLANDPGLVQSVPRGRHTVVAAVLAPAVDWLVAGGFSVEIIAGGRQACRRCGVMTRAPELRANREAVPNSAPMRLGVLHHVLRHLVGRGEPGNMLGGPVDAG